MTEVFDKNNTDYIADIKIGNYNKWLTLFPNNAEDILYDTISMYLLDKFKVNDGDGPASDGSRDVINNLYNDFGVYIDDKLSTMILYGMAKCAYNFMPENDKKMADQTITMLKARMDKTFNR